VIEAEYEIAHLAEFPYFAAVDLFAGILCIQIPVHIVGKHCGKLNGGLVTQQNGERLQIAARVEVLELLQRHFGRKTCQE
jgi:hypothetical protein